MAEKLLPVEEAKAKLQQMKDEMNPLWVQLPEKMQTFIEAFIELRSPGKAAQAAYTCKDDKSARTKGKTLLIHWKVRAILSQLGGYEVKGSNLTRDETLSLISDRLRDLDTDSTAFTKLMQMYLMLTGQIKRGLRGIEVEDQERPNSRTEPDVDDMVLQAEKQQKEKNG
jgi:hypothetical protein